MQQTDALPIVLLHGWGMNKEVWRGLLAQVPQGLANRVYRLDLPGFGDNKTVPNLYSMENLSAWLDTEVERILSETKAKQCHVVGWSLGGLVALQYALEYQDKVNSLGLIASTTKFQAESKEGQLDWPGIKPEVLSNFAKQLEANHQLTIQRFLAIQTLGSESAKQDVKQLKTWLLDAGEPDQKALAGGLDLLKTVDLNHRIGELSVPVFGLYGKLDSLVPVAVLDRLNASIPNLEVSIINKASHAPFISHVEQSAQWFETHF